MKIQKSSSSLNQVVSELNHHGIQISKMLVENDETADADLNSVLIVRIQVKLIKPIKFEEVIITLATIDGVLGLETGGESL